MPQINRIRVNNVKYNFGTQFYDNFIMSFSCKNTIYDLANGGGKSVLMLLLFQNLIPNCTLDDKQPVEKLFRTGSGSSTIHSLIEWKLDSENIKNNYKYMLTGFCARKAKEDESINNADGGNDNASIEYFNYCIFYREFNDNDIKNLPLSNGKERITYNGLKSYLRELEKKDFSLEVKIFERKGEYQRFIAEYGLFESQWEIIKGINKTEGHVRTYFETNYKTARKVVEDLLIEEIIEKSFKTRASVDAPEGNSGGEVMAKTLLDIKDKLIELSRRRDDIAGYDRQIEAIESFIGRISGIRQLYFGREDLENQIVKSYNTLNQIVSDREKTLEDYGIKAKELMEEKNTLEKKAATVRVQKTEGDILEMDRIIEELTVKLLSHRDEYGRKKSELLIKESENDYMDYLYYKSERDSLKSVIDEMSSGNTEENNIRSELIKLGYEKKKRNEARKETLAESVLKDEETLHKEMMFIKEYEEKENACIKDISVAEYLSADYEKRLKEINAAVYKEKEKLDMIMSVDVSGQLKNEEAQIRDTKEELGRLSEEIIEAAQRGKVAEYEKNMLEIKLSAIDEDIDRLINKRSDNQQIINKIRKMEELYGERNIDNLVNTAGETYKEVIGEAARAGEEISALRRYVKNLENGCPVGDSHETEEVLKYIEKYHGDMAVSGSRYISELSEDKKNDIMERVPILPYSIVIKSGYGRIISDPGLKKILTGDYAVPVIKEDAVKNSEYLFDTSVISFVMGDDSLFKDPEAIAAELSKAVCRLKNIEERKLKLDETEETLRADYDFIKEYRDVHRNNILQNEKEYEEKKLIKKKLSSDLEGMDESRAEIYLRESELKSREEKLNKKLKILTDKTEALKRVAALQEEVLSLEQHMREQRLKKDALKKEYGDIWAKIRAGKDRAEYRKSRITAVKNEINTIDEKWDELFKAFCKDTDNVETAGCEDLSDDEINTKAKAYNEIMAGALSDRKDKQKLMDNYDLAMEKSLQAIDYKGVNLQDIKNNYAMGLVRRYDREELISFKMLLDGAEKTVKELEADIAGKRTVRDRLEGAVIHGREAIEEKYGSYEKIPGDWDSISLDRILSESKNSIEGIDRALEDIDYKREEILSTSKEYIIYKRDIDKIMENANIINTDENNVWDSGIDFKEKIRLVSDRYEKFKEDISARKDELEYEKNILYDTLKTLSSYQLADEIRNNVSMPKSISETEELMGNLEDIISCIKLEKDRVEKSIEDMERIKDSFENQCIQCCINIKTELERLPKLSIINMDGEPVSMIGLNIPYIKEDMYKQHMSKYIDDIVESADGLRNGEERIKYIRNQLSWKKLFSVIVTDMNIIRLTLYKRERIKEQSRYLRYEEAVGSTGQSQGIYIQFLISVINYIASINSGNTESRRLGKTVFIDNPFGAAKDIYIWEPIFRLLKTNNVQLIVPCRGATPAITGRFDVNYILGQKMTDGKQQTVVVEYYSNVEGDNIEYEKLSFEQNRLTFE